METVSNVSPYKHNMITIQETRDDYKLVVPRVTVSDTEDPTGFEASQ